MNKDNKYQCELILNNSSNFDKIIGEHLSGKSNDDVEEVYKDGSADLNWPIFPRIICEKFYNLKEIELRNRGFERIDEDSLENCRNLEIFVFTGKNIKSLPKNLFKRNAKLIKLRLCKNQLEDLPENIFAPLINLEVLHLEANKLKTLHSDSFGIHRNLTKLRFESNYLNAFDESIFDNSPLLKTIDCSSNVCVNGNAALTDDSKSKTEMRKVLKKCFENYKQRESISESISRINDENEKIKIEIQEFKVYAMIFGVLLIVAIIIAILIIMIIFCHNSSQKDHHFYVKELNRKPSYETAIPLNDYEPNYEMIREPNYLAMNPPISTREPINLPKSINDPEFFSNNSMYKNQ